MPGKVWDEITYPFPNFNGCTVEVWEWISNFIPHFYEYVITYPCSMLVTEATAVYPMNDVHYSWFIVVWNRSILPITCNHQEITSPTAWCKTAITPVRYQWSYCFLALSHRHINKTKHNKAVFIFHGMLQTLEYKETGLWYQPEHFCDVTWTSWRLKSPASGLYVRQRIFRPTTKKTPKIHITVLLWWKSTGQRWIPFTKGR